MDALPAPLFRHPDAEPGTCGAVSKLAAVCIRPVLTDGQHDPAWWDTDDHVGPIPGLDMSLPFGNEDALTCQP